jgi:membrane protease YdiL (CAAX protease family)
MKQTLSVAPSRKELLWGSIYLILELTVLPLILTQILDWLKCSLSAGQVNVVFFIVSFGATTLIFRKFIQKSLLDAIFRFSQILRGALRGFLLYWAGNTLVTALILGIRPDFMNVNDATIDTMMQSDFFPLAICTIFFVPITEELLFRGILFAGFYNRSPVKAFLISCAVFSAIHIVGYIGSYSWDTLLLCFIQYIPPSIALGFAYAKSGSILAPMLMHIAINAIGIFAMR